MERLSKAAPGTELHWESAEGKSVVLGLMKDALVTMALSASLIPPVSGNLGFPHTTWESVR